MDIRPLKSFRSGQLKLRQHLRRLPGLASHRGHRRLHLSACGWARYRRAAGCDEGKRGKKCAAAQRDLRKACALLCTTRGPPRNAIAQKGFTHHGSLGDSVEGSQPAAQLVVLSAADPVRLYFSTLHPRSLRDNPLASSSPHDERLFHPRPGSTKRATASRTAKRFLINAPP